jgi:hypothetical protein
VEKTSAGGGGMEDGTSSCRKKQHADGYDTTQTQDNKFEFTAASSLLRT